MAYKISQKDKIAGYDSLKSERDKLSFALHDLVNARFSTAVRIKTNEVYFSDKDPGYFTLQVAERGCKLYLFCYHSKDQHTQVFVHDEIEVENQRDTNSQYWRVFRYGLWKLSQAAKGVA